MNDIGFERLVDVFPVHARYATAAEDIASLAELVENIWGYWVHHALFVAEPALTSMAEGDAKLLSYLAHTLDIHRRLKGVMEIKVSIAFWQDAQALRNQLESLTYALADSKSGASRNQKRLATFLYESLLDSPIKFSADTINHPEMPLIELEELFYERLTDSTRKTH